MAEQRIAVVTGSASGIGLAIAKGLLADGLRVVLADRSESVRDVARELSPDGKQAEAYVVDVSDEQQILKFCEYVKGLGRCDVLVNNAGVHPKHNGKHYDMPDISFEAWETVLRINLSAPFLLCQQLLPLMQKHKFGRIINIASRAGRTFIPPVGVHYSASKAGLIGLTRQIAGQFAGFGITANCIAPGRIETPLSSQSSAEVIAAATKGIPVGRLGTTDEIAAAARFLASDGAGYTTGIVIDVNGGVFMPS
ncbi:MAG: SDR family NAD(P)-dependent oxidoreductase [Janthinobacterium lividum]